MAVATANKFVIQNRVYHRLEGYEGVNLCPVLRDAPPVPERQIARYSHRLGLRTAEMAIISRAFYSLGKHDAAEYSST